MTSKQTAENSAPAGSLREALTPDLAAFARELKKIALESDKAADKLAAIKLIHDIIGDGQSGGRAASLTDAIREAVRVDSG